MPQVASEPKTHALNHPLPHSPRPAQASDRAPATPFESLLDDGAPSAPKQPTQPSADDKAPRATRAQPAQPAPKAKGNKAAKTSESAKSADAGKSAKTAKSDKTVTTGDVKSVGADKAAADAIALTAEDDSKLVGDGKPADNVALRDIAFAPSADPIQTMTSADAIAAALAPPADPIQTVTSADAVATALAPPADPIQKMTSADAVATALAPAPEPAPATDAARPAAPAADKTDIAAGSAPKTAPDLLAAQDVKIKTDKPADEPKLAVKTAPQLHTEGKPQPAAGEPDKDAIVTARGELPANNHRAATAEAPATPGADANAAAPKALADAAQPMALTAPSHAAPASPANALPATPAAPAALHTPDAVPLAGVAIEIASKARAGNNHFEIRLDPPELGRIEVRLDVDRDGNVTSRMIADRPDTLDLLRRDAAGLERALQDAGLKTSDNGMQFSLRDQSAHQQQANSGADTARLMVEDETLIPIDEPQRDYGRLAGRVGGLDIRV